MLKSWKFGAAAGVICLLALSTFATLYVSFPEETAAGAAPRMAAMGKAEKYLYVWAGPDAPGKADFLAVVDFDESSPKYGSVIATETIPGKGSSGNKPQDVGLSRERNTLAAGGLLQGQPNKGGWPQSMQMTGDGKRLFLSLYLAGKVAMFDTSTPEKPRLLKLIDLGPGSGPHFLRLTANEQRLVISDYFLHEDKKVGRVQADGDRKIHVAKVTKNDLVLDSRFRLDFDDLPSGPARPHGIAMK